MDIFPMTIVFLHGFLGSALDFQPIAQQLATTIEGQCLCLDLPGHGRSIDLPAETYTFLGAANFVLSQISHLDNPALYGYSMGGRLALYLGLTYPNRFSHLFLESASPGLADEVDRITRRTHDAQLATALQRDFSGFLDRWYNAPLFETLRQHPSFPEIRHRRNNNSPTELAKALQGMGTGTQPSLWKTLPSAQCPMDLLVGTHDPKFVALNTTIQTHCPTATLNLMPNVGHNIHAENPEAIVQLLQSRLGSHLTSHLGSQISVLG
jgi:2-succinyl-6-hydroxy-2,4-cyclohexadiene-1-carboxylate synthase